MFSKQSKTQKPCNMTVIDTNQWISNGKSMTVQSMENNGQIIINKETLLT